MKLFTGRTLKIIALLTMLIDHIGAIFFPHYRVLRCIGRIAFPLYSFLLTVGYRHTRSKRNALIVLTIFAVISEIPFNLAFYGRLVYVGHQNVFFTLALAYLAMIAYDFISNRVRFFGYERILGFLPCVGIMLLAEFIRTDYGALGVAQVFVFFILKERPLIMFLMVALLNTTSPIQCFAILSFVFIYLFNGKRGKQLKWLYYIAYPAHLLIYAIIAGLIGIRHYDFGIFSS